MGADWLLGPKRNVSLGLGFGLTRILSSDDENYFLKVLPSPRVNIGIAFRTGDPSQKRNPTNVERKGREARKASDPTVFFATFARFAFDVVFRWY